MRALVASALAAFALLSLASWREPGPSSAAPPVPVETTEAAPRGMIAFVVGGACPAGWAPAALATGRLLVGTDNPQAVGRVVGVPLAAEEDRPHRHAITTATIALPYKSISAANGGNQAGAASGHQPITGAADLASSGLPFLQLPACTSP